MQLARSKSGTLAVCKGAGRLIHEHFGSLLPFILRVLGLEPASAWAPLAATLVDATGLLIYATVAALILAAPCFN